MGHLLFSAHHPAMFFIALHAKKMADSAILSVDFMVGTIVAIAWLSTQRVTN